MNRRLRIHSMLGLILVAGMALAGNLVDQGAPGAQGPWKVTTGGGMIGAPKGVITSTGTSVNNTTTAVPFTTITDNRLYWVQCDAAANILPGTSASATISNGNYGVKVAANDILQVWLNSGTNKIAMISVTGTANCAVWPIQ